MEDAVDIPHVEDVGPAVREQHTLLAVRLALHKRVDLSERRLLAFGADLVPDLAVERGAGDRRVVERRLQDRLFGLLEEPLLEVVADVGDLDAGLGLGAVVELELLARHELLGGRGEGEHADLLEERRIQRLQAAHAPEHIPVDLVDVGVAEIGEKALGDDRLDLIAGRVLEHRKDLRGLIEGPVFHWKSSSACGGLWRRLIPHHAGVQRAVIKGTNLVFEL